MESFTTGIEMELHISPKISCCKTLRAKGFDDSRSASKAVKQRKKNLTSVHRFLETMIEKLKCPAFVKDD